MAQVMLALRDAASRRALAALLQAQGHLVSPQGSAEEALVHLEGASAVDVVVTDIWHPGSHGTQWVTRLMQARPSAALLVLFNPTEHADAVECLKAGATDVMLAPPHADELLWRLQRAVGLQAGGDQGRVAELQRALADAQLEARGAVEARSSLEATLLRVAVVDPLTGLSNRRVWDEKLAAEHFRARRFGRSLSLLVMDVDHADRVERLHGSATLQEVIKQMGRYLREGLRDTDVAARIDDDEFGLLLVETPITGARDLAQQLKRVMASASFPNVGRVTASMGVVGLDPIEHKDPVAFWEAARLLLRKAKDGGRDRVEG
jgi:diguanylate cyclase (GGDEF)-like protein